MSSKRLLSLLLITIAMLSTPPAQSDSYPPGYNALENLSRKSPLVLMGRIDDVRPVGEESLSPHDKKIGRRYRDVQFQVEKVLRNDSGQALGGHVTLRISERNTTIKAEPGMSYLLYLWEAHDDLLPPSIPWQMVNGFHVTPEGDFEEEFTTYHLEEVKKALIDYPYLMKAVRAQAKPGSGSTISLKEEAEILPLVLKWLLNKKDFSLPENCLISTQNLQTRPSQNFSNLPFQVMSPEAIKRKAAQDGDTFYFRFMPLKIKPESQGESILVSFDLLIEIRKGSIYTGSLRISNHLRVLLHRNSQSGQWEKVSDEVWA